MSHKFDFDRFRFSIELYEGFVEDSEVTITLDEAFIKKLNPREAVYVTDSVFSCSLSDLGHFTSSSNNVQMFMFDEDEFCSLLISKIVRSDLSAGFARKFAAFVNSSNLRFLKKERVDDLEVI